MITVDLTLKVLSFWHVGTGRGGGADFDAVVFRSAAGLPLIPGRQVKGILRDALTSAWRAGVFPGLRESPAVALFGSDIEDTVPAALRNAENREEALEAGRYLTTEGSLWVRSAVLGADPTASARWEAWARGRPRALAEFFRPFASTALEEDGTARDQTLRNIEVVVPMTLRAEIDGPEGEWPEQIEQSLCFLDGVGSHRSRGLGRVEGSLRRRS